MEEEEREEGVVMVTVAFEKNTPLGMAFAKNRSGYFVVQSVQGQSKDKSVKVGDVIMTINDELVESGWTQRDVVSMIKELNAPDIEEPLVISFDRQYRQSAVHVIKKRVVDRKAAKGLADGTFPLPQVDRIRARMK